jgi:transcriptional regulator with GAF, ATPase, and Fis domain
LNFNCIFTTCNYKQNNIEESEFLKHLQNEHTKEIIDISKKENMSIKAVEMITISNSTVFINSN